MSHLPLPNDPTLLILGGTSEARALAKHVAVAGITAMYSYAGRTASPVRIPIPTRIGGYGGSEGLTKYLVQNGITHVVDATHPFAQKMSRNAVQACESTGVHLIALTRPPWEPGARDVWIEAPDMEHAVAALATEPQRIFLAIGKQEVDAFAAQPQHHYLLRFVDAPDTPPTLPDHRVVTGRGPFSVENDMALLREHKISLVVSKNSGGSGAVAKLLAARELDLPVLMINRPRLPERQIARSVDDVMDWISQTGTIRGV